MWTGVLRSPGLVETSSWIGFNVLYYKALEMEQEEHVKIIFPILFFPISVSFDIFFLPSKTLFHLTVKATHSLVFSWMSDRLQVGFCLAAVCLCQYLVCLCLCSLVRVAEIVTLALPKIVMKMKLAYVKCFAQCPAQGLPHRYAEMTVQNGGLGGRGYSWRLWPSIFTALH